MKITNDWKDAVITKNAILFIRNKYFKKYLFGIPFLFLLLSLINIFLKYFHTDTIFFTCVGLALLSPDDVLEKDWRLVNVLPIEIHNYFLYQVFFETIIIQICFVFSVIITYLISLLISPIKFFIPFFIFILVGSFIFFSVNNILRYRFLYIYSSVSKNANTAKTFLYLIPVLVLLIVSFFSGFTFYIVSEAPRFFALGYLFLLALSISIFIALIVRSTIKKLRTIEY